MFMFQSTARFPRVFALYLGLIFQGLSTWGESAAEALPPIRIIVNETELVGGKIALTSSAFVRIEPNYGADRVYYTTDGSEPSIVNGVNLKYGRQIGIYEEQTRLRVIAYNLDFTQSVRAEVMITILPPAELRVRGNTRLEVVTHIGTTNVVDLPRTLYLGSNQTVRLRAVNRDLFWRFKEWRGATNSTNETIEIKMDRNRELDLVAVTTNHPPLEVIGQGEVILDPPPPYEYRQLYQITARARPGHFFIGWGGGLELPSSYSRKMESPGLPIKATFAPLPEGYHSLTLVGTGNVAMPRLERYAFTNGTRVGIFAEVGDGHTFTGWSGDAAGSDPYLEVVMDKSMTITGGTRRVIAWESSWENRYVDERWVYLTTPALGADGTVYAGLQNNLVALDNQGYLKWSLPVSTDWIRTPVVGPDDMIYAFGNEGLWAVTPTGEVRWRVNPGGEHLAVSAERLYLSSTNGLIRKIGAGGTMLTTLQLQPSSGTNSYELALDAVGNVYAYDQFTLISLTSNLVERFRRVYPTGLRKGSLGIAANGNVFFGTGNELVAMSPDGRELWNNPFDLSPWTTVGSDRVYINAVPLENIPAAGPVQAVGVDGLLKWEGFTITPAERSISTTVTEDGTLLHLSIIRSTTGTNSHASLRLLRPDGSVIADYHFYNALHPQEAVSHGVLGPDGMYYFTAGRMRAVPTGLKPAKTGWPMPRGDWRNSGQAYVVDIPAPPEDALQVKITPSLMTLRFEASVVGTFKLESASDLRTWTEAQSFTNDLNLELPFPTNRQSYFRVVRPAGN